MKKDNKVIRDKWLHLRLTGDEQKQIQKNCAATTEDKICAYARKILLGKPVVSYYRNRSLDDLITELTTLNKTLNGIANNYNQSVHKLHTLDHVPQVKVWLEVQQNAPANLLESIEAVRVIARKLLENGSSH